MHDTANASATEQESTLQDVVSVPLAEWQQLIASVEHVQRMQAEVQQVTGELLTTMRAAEHRQQVSRDRQQRYRDRKRATRYVTPVLPIEDQDQDLSLKKEDPRYVTSVTLTPERLAHLWNQHRGPLPQCITLHGQRRQHAHARIKTWSDEQQWVSCITTLAANPFYAGQNDRGWQADFDYLLRPATMSKFLEGHFAVRNGNGRSAEQQRQHVRASNVQHVANAGIYVPPVDGE